MSKRQQMLRELSEFSRTYLHSLSKEALVEIVIGVWKEEYKKMRVPELIRAHEYARIKSSEIKENK